MLSTRQRWATEAPDDPKPALVLSAYRGRIGDLDGALAAAEDALRAAPDDLTARLRKAELLVALGFLHQDKARIEAGKKIVAQVLAAEAGQPEALFVEAKIDLAERRPGDAAKALRRVVEGGHAANRGDPGELLGAARLADAGLAREEHQPSAKLADSALVEAFGRHRSGAVAGLPRARCAHGVLTSQEPGPKARARPGTYGGADGTRTRGAER
jgi:cytochrome c-type biogenesis protein CcmH/NrfG